MTRQDFVKQLEALGYKTENGYHPNFVVFNYEIQTGTRIGQRVKLAFSVSDDFPLNPPGGPCVSPRILPIHPAADLPHPFGAIHPKDELGPDWEYWSRPFQNWNATDRTVRTYLAYIRRLFEDL